MIYLAIAICSTSVVLSCNQNLPSADNCCHEFFAGNKSCQDACMNVLHLRRFNRTIVARKRSEELYASCKITSAEFGNCLENAELKLNRQPIRKCLPELNFCRNFFHLHDNLCAMKCDYNGDRAARSLFRRWSKNLNFSTKNSVDSIRLWSVDQCRPSRWRLLACTLSIQPFVNATGRWAVCRKDCIDLLISCSDTPIDTQTILRICERISVKHDRCFPLENVPFLDLFTFEAKRKFINPRRQASTTTNDFSILSLLLILISPVIFIFFFVLISRCRLRARSTADQIGVIDSV